MISRRPAGNQVLTERCCTSMRVAPRRSIASRKCGAQRGSNVARLASAGRNMSRSVLNRCCHWAARTVPPPNHQPRSPSITEGSSSTRVARTVRKRPRAGSGSVRELLMPPSPGPVIGAREVVQPVLQFVPVRPCPVCCPNEVAPSVGVLDPTPEQLAEGSRSQPGPQHERLSRRRPRRPHGVIQLRCRGRRTPAGALGEQAHLDCTGLRADGDAGIDATAPQQLRRKPWGILSVEPIRRQEVARLRFPGVSPGDDHLLCGGVGHGTGLYAPAARAVPGRQPG